MDLFLVLSDFAAAVEASRTLIEARSTDGEAPGRFAVGVYWPTIQRAVGVALRPAVRYCVDHSRPRLAIPDRRPSSAGHALDPACTHQTAGLVPQPAVAVLEAADQQPALPGSPVLAGAVPVLVPPRPAALAVAAGVSPKPAAAADGMCHTVQAVDQRMDGFGYAAPGAVASMLHLVDGVA